jgi:hypothetical protein
MHKIVKNTFFLFIIKSYFTKIEMKLLALISEIQVTITAV